MKTRRRHRWPVRVIRVTGAAFSIIALFAGTASTAANMVPVSNADNPTRQITAADMAPDECHGLLVNIVVVGTGVVAGTPDNDWIIGNNVADTISGLTGDDCIEGNDADDVIDGGPGNDVCIGGPGNDTFLNCESRIH